MTNSIITQRIVIGSRVICPFRGIHGVVYDITKQENKVYTVFGGMKPISQIYGVVFQNGTINRALPSTMLDGCHGWKVLESLASAEEIAELLELAEKYGAIAQFEAKTVQESKASAFQVKKEALAGQADLSGFLAQGDDKYSGKLAAQNIRKELKRTFPGVKFSVRKPSFGAVYISWIDGATVAAVEAIVSKYKSGSFNSMEDIYENAPTPFNAVYGGADYIFTERSFSDGLISRAINKVFLLHAKQPESTKPTVAEFRSGALFMRHEMGESLQRLILEAASAMDC